MLCSFGISTDAFIVVVAVIRNLIDTLHVRTFLTGAVSFDSLLVASESLVSEASISKSYTCISLIGIYRYINKRFSEA